jgi:hypothetical protein
MFYFSGYGVVFRCRYHDWRIIKVHIIKLDQAMSKIQSQVTVEIPEGTHWFNLIDGQLIFASTDDR